MFGIVYVLGVGVMQLCSESLSMEIWDQVENCSNVCLLSVFV